MNNLEKTIGFEELSTFCIDQVCRKENVLCSC